MLKPSLSDFAAIFPRAPKEVLFAFADKTGVLDKAGITASATRLAYFCANVEHECDGFTILTENINYTAAGMARTWPSRFRSAADVRARFGTAPGWQKAAFDVIYGGRMGNRPGTRDGSTYIGRGGPQVTGRDGYQQIGDRCGLALVESPTSTSNPYLQPEVCAAFWEWKALNAFADRCDFVGCVKAWNGGANGMADRRALMAGNDPIIQRLAAARPTIDAVNAIPVEYPLVDDVEGLQRALNALGWTPSLIVDGQYGSLTKTAVKDFQSKHGLAVDGIAGPKTHTSVQSALAAATA